MDNIKMKSKITGLFLFLFVMCFNLTQAVEIENINIQADSTYAILELDTSELTQVKVSYSQSASFDTIQLKTSPNITKHHKIIITGLEKNTTYYYKIEAFTSDASRTLDCPQTSYTNDRCNIPGPNYGACVCGTGTQADCGTSDDLRFCVNNRCRSDVPEGFNVDFSNCLPRNFTTPNNDSLEPFLWIDVPKGVAQANFVIAGFAEPNSQVNITINNELVKIFSVSQSGYFSTTLSVDESIPSNLMNLVIQDNSGKLIQKDFSFIVDLYPPELENPSQIPSIIGSNHFNFSGSVNEEVFIHYIVTQDDQTNEEEILVGPGSFNVPVPLHEGRNSVFLEYYDHAGLGQKITRTPGNPRLYTQDIISDTLPPVIIENNLGELSPTIVRFRQAQGTIKDSTATTVSVKTKVIDSTFFSFTDLDNNQYDSRSVGSWVRLNSKDFSSGENNFELDFVLPININARAYAQTQNTGANSQSSEMGGSISTELDLEVILIVEDAVGHQTNLTQIISFAGGCGSNSDYIVEFGDVAPDKFDPYLIQQGLGELYIPFTIEYMGTGSFPQISSESYGARNSGGIFDEKIFDWDAIGPCDVEIVGEEGAIVCPLRPYTPKEHEASSVVDPAQALEEAFAKADLEFNYLKIPTKFQFSYTTLDFNGNSQTKTFEECSEVTIQIDTDLFDESKIPEIINASYNFFDGLKNATEVFDEGLTWGIQVGIYAYFGTGLGTIVNRFNEIKACRGMSVGVDNKDSGDFNWAIDGITAIGDVLLARPSAADKFNFEHGSPEDYCTDVYPDPDNDNPQTKACQECKDAMKKSNDWENNLRNPIGDRLFCPSVPTYQEFVRQRYLSLRQAQISARLVGGNDKPILFVSDKVTNKPSAYKFGTATKEEYKDIPLDFACEQQIMHVINNNDEIEKVKLFADITPKDLDPTKPFDKDDTMQVDEWKNSCVKEYFKEYNSACLGGSALNGLYKKSRNYQIQVANEVRAKETSIKEQNIFETLGFFYDKLSSISQLCSMENQNNSHYKEIISDDVTFLTSLGVENPSQKVQDSQTTDTSYGFLVQGSKVYFVEANSQAIVEDMGDRTFRVGQSDLQFGLEDTGTKRIYVNRYGCAFSERLPESGTLADDVNTNPHYFYPTDDWGRCRTPESVNIGDDVAQEFKLLGPIPKRVYDDIIFEGGKTTLYDPNRDFFSGAQCGCLSSVAAANRRWNRMLVLVTDCLDAARSGGPIQDYQCYEFFSEQLCDAVYTMAECLFKSGSGQGAEMSLPSSFRRDGNELKEGMNWGASDMFSSTQALGDTGTERYGASYTGMLELSSKQLLYSACYSFLGLPIPDDLQLFAGTGLADSLVDNVILEPIGMITKSRGIYAGQDKNRGYAKFMYQVAPMVMSSSEGTQVQVELVCSNDYSCDFESGHCDCVNYPIEQTMVIDSFALGNNEEGGDLLTPILAKPYRFNKVRVTISYRDESGQRIQLDPIERNIDYSGSMPSDCNYIEDYQDLTTTATGGYVCSKYEQSPSQVMISALDASNDPAYALTSRNGQPSTKRYIGLKEFTVTVDEGLYNTNNNADMEQYAYDPVAESQSSQAGYENPMNARYWTLLVKNEEGSVLEIYPSIRGPDSSTMLLPGENVFGPGGTNNLANIYELDFARMVGDESSLGRVIRRNIHGTNIIGANPRINSPGIVSDRTLIVEIKTKPDGDIDTVRYKVGPQQASSADECNGGTEGNPANIYDGYCWVETSSLTTIQDTEKDGKEFEIDNVVFSVNQVNTEGSYYIFNFEKKEEFDTADSGYEICENGGKYTIEFNIHSTRRDGTPDPQIAETKAVEVNVGCWEREDASSTTSTPSVEDVSGCHNSDALCTSELGGASTSCGFGMPYDKIGMCHDDDACCTLTLESCSRAGGVLVEDKGCDLGGQLGLDMNGMECCEPDKVLSCDKVVESGFYFSCATSSSCSSLNGNNIGSMNCEQNEICCKINNS